MLNQLLFPSSEQVQTNWQQSLQTSHHQRCLNLFVLVPLFLTIFLLLL